MIRSMGMGSTSGLMGGGMPGCGRTGSSMERGSICCLMGWREWVSGRKGKDRDGKMKTHPLPQETTTLEELFTNKMITYYYY